MSCSWLVVGYGNAHPGNQGFQERMQVEKTPSDAKWQAANRYILNAALFVNSPESF
jgi:hypothetical protein